MLHLCFLLSLSIGTHADSPVFSIAQISAEPIARMLASAQSDPGKDITDDPRGKDPHGDSPHGEIHDGGLPANSKDLPANKPDQYYGSGYPPKF